MIEFLLLFILITLLLMGLLIEHYSLKIIKLLKGIKEQLETKVIEEQEAADAE